MWALVICSVYEGYVARDPQIKGPYFGSPMNAAPPESARGEKDSLARPLRWFYQGDTRVWGLGLKVQG